MLMQLYVLSFGDGVLGAHEFCILDRLFGSSVNANRDRPKHQTKTSWH